jgi:hypothetical protein
MTDPNLLKFEDWTKQQEFEDKNWIVIARNGTSDGTNWFTT